MKRTKNAYIKEPMNASMKDLTPQKLNKEFVFLVISLISTRNLRIGALLRVLFERAMRSLILLNNQMVVQSVLNNLRQLMLALFT